MQGVTVECLGCCCFHPVYLAADAWNVVLEIDQGSGDERLLFPLVCCLVETGPVFKSAVHRGDYGITVQARPGFGVVERKGL